MKRWEEEKQFGNKVLYVCHGVNLILFKYFRCVSEYIGIFMRNFIKRFLVAESLPITHVLSLGYSNMQANRKLLRVIQLVTSNIIIEIIKRTFIFLKRLERSHRDLIWQQDVNGFTNYPKVKGNIMSLNKNSFQTLDK